MRVQRKFGVATLRLNADEVTAAIDRHLKPIDPCHIIKGSNMETDFMHPVYLLAFLTLLIVAGVAIWSLWSTKRQQQPGPTKSGPGGPNDLLR